MITLRPYQESGIADIRAAFGKGARAVCYVAPTGSGKRVLFTSIAESQSRLGKRAWILVHRRELLSQASAELTAEGVYHGVICAGITPDYHAPVQVASIQTIRNRLGKVQRTDLIILDECHHAVSPTWRVAIATQPQAKVLGVTATPCRLDGKGLGHIFDALVLGPRVSTLMEAGFLAPFRAFAPPSNIDTGRVHTVAGDYDRAELEEAAAKSTITGDAVREYARHGNGAPAIVFGISVAHAEHIAAAFNAAGFRAASVDGKMPKAQRDSNIGGLANGRIQVLTSCDLISEGLDIPAVGCAILCRPTKSLGLYRQQVGRALRPGPGKVALILDHAGNIERHGLPDEEPEWTLEGAKRKPKAAGVKICQECFAAYTGARCPECGAVPKPPTGERPGLQHVEGDLVEFKRGQERAAAAFGPKLSYRDAVAAARAATSLDEVRAIARRQGYKQGWAWHVWNDRDRSKAAVIDRAFKAFGLA